MAVGIPKADPLKLTCPVPETAPPATSKAQAFGDAVVEVRPQSVCAIEWPAQPYEDPPLSRNVSEAMPHASNLVMCDGPDSPHAFDIIPLKPRNGMLDARCPVCRGYGEWNQEIDLVSFRSKRTVCDRCLGAGWVETGNDPVGYPDIEMSPDGKPQWVVNYVPREDVAEEDVSGGDLLAP